MLLDSFLDKKSIQEITNIFRQRVLYQLASSKDQVPDISVPQQDKINRFLNCFHVHFHDYLIGEDTYQHMDFYRILSKEIKVFNFGKGQKFRKSHYDGLYIILRGSIEETILEAPPAVDNHHRFSPSPSKTKLLKGKKRPTDQFRMANIVNMVVGLNRLLPSSRRESLQQINEDPHLEPSSPAPYQISSFNKEQHQQTKETPNKSIYSTPDHHGNNDKQFFQSHQQQHPLKFETNEDSKNFKDLNSEGSSGHSTPVVKRINSQADSYNFTSCLGFSKHAEKPNGINSQNSLADVVGELPETIGPIASLERSSFSELNEQHSRQFGSLFLPQSCSTFSLKHGNSFQYNPIGSLSSMGSSTMLRQPFSFIDNFKRAHKIFYAGEAVNLTKVSEKDRQYATSEHEDCIYLYISKKSMQRAFHEQINQLQFKTNVLEKVFHNVPPNKILKLAYHLYEVVLYKNQAVYNIGDTQPFFAYMIKSGEVQISEDINQCEDSKKSKEQEDNDYPDSTTSNEDDNSIDGGSDHISDKNNSEYFIPNGIGCTNSQRNQTKKKSSRKFKRSGSAELQELCLKQLKRPQTARNTWKKDATLKKEVLCCVGAEELFGLEELVKKKEKRYLSAIVSSSSAEFFVLPAEHFNNFYLTEADSINLWFKQKELFYAQQRNLIKRMKKEQSFTTATQQALSKTVKKQCHHLFQEDEHTFESKLDSLQKKQLLSLTKFSEYKSYTEMQIQSGKELVSNNNSVMYGQTQQKSIQTAQTSSCQTGSTQQGNSSLYIHGLKNLSLSNLPPYGEEKINSGRRSIMYSKTPQASNKGDFFRPQGRQVSGTGTGATKTIATTPKNQSFQQKISPGIRSSFIETDTSKVKYPATESLHQKSERAIVNKFSLGNIQEKIRIYNALESSQDLGNLGTPRRQGQQESCEYISSAQSTQRQQSQHGNTSQPHLGRIFNMVKENKVIVKQQLENLGGKVDFKQPIFDELKSDNLKQALKFVHKRKQLLQANLESKEETHDGSKTARIRTTSNQQRTHPSRNDQYNNLLKKVRNVQSHQESQAYQLLSNLGNNSVGCCGGSVSSLSTSTLGLNSHRSKKTTHSGNSMQILTPNSMPILTLESPRRSETPLVMQHAQPQAINIHMRNKRSVERKSGPYFTRTSPGLIVRHEEHKMVKNAPIIIEETTHARKKKVVNNQELLSYYQNKTTR